MKPPFILRRRAFAAAMLGAVALPLAGFADDLTPPIVVNPLTDLTVAAGTTGSVVNLKKTFALSGVTGQIVRMATSVKDAAGNPMNIDIELLANAAPLNVANFLQYVNSGEYNKTFIHRSVPATSTTPAFVIQGGGYYVVSSSAGYEAEHIAQNAPVAGEHTLSNTRGTLALALSTGPDSGTSEWFFNLSDNTQLDGTSDGGPFTVFARVIEDDMTTVDAVAALPIFDLSSGLNNGACNTVPVDVPAGTTNLSIDELVYLNDVVVVPLVPPSVGADSVLALKVKNNNPGLVTATITGRKLKLAYIAGKTGSAAIKVFATDSAGSRAKAKFTVTVQ